MHVAIIKHVVTAVVTAVVGSLVACGVLLGFNIKRLPAGSPFHVARSLRDGTLPPGSTDAVVALIGDSHTHGFCGSNWVASLRDRHRKLVLVNAGMNGNLAWNVDQRLAEILDLHPRAAVLLIGSNDAMGSFNEYAAQLYKYDMRLPQLPTPDFFRDNLRRVLGRLRQAGVPRRAVVTLPPLGEDPSSEINRLVSALNADIRTIGVESGATILPLNEKVWQLIHEQRGDRAPPPMGEYLPVNRWPMVTAIGKRHLLGRTWDDIADDRGLVALVDAIHLSDRGGKLLEDLVSDFLNANLDLR